MCTSVPSSLRPGKTRAREETPNGRRCGKLRRRPEDGKWNAQVTFDEPGTYVLRWHATDGALWADEDITVTVTP